MKHRLFGFRGVIFDIDPVFANSEEWYQAIPGGYRGPSKDQPFYHLLAEKRRQSSYVAYVSQQNLESDESDEPDRSSGDPAALFEPFCGRSLRAPKREHRH